VKGAERTTYLDGYFGTEMRRNSIIVADVGDDVYPMLRRVGRQLGKEQH
jgi:hypothetical protein